MQNHRLKKPGLSLFTICGLILGGLAPLSPLAASSPEPIWRLTSAQEGEASRELVRANPISAEGYGEGLEFMGNGSRAMIQERPDLSQKDSATVTLFFRCNQLPTPREEGGTAAAALFSCAYDLLVRVYPGGEVYGAFRNRDGDLIGAFSDKKVSTDEWHHVAVVFSTPEKQLRIYLDGSLVATTKGEVGELAPLPISPLVIGSDPDKNDFLGAVTDLQLFDRALTQEEIGEVIRKAQTAQ